MLYPEINKLRDEAGSRYYLVSMASKRARDIISGSPKLDSTIKTNKPVSIAAEEVGKGLFKYKTIEQVEEEADAAEKALAEAEAYAKENSVKVHQVELIGLPKIDDELEANLISEEADFEEKDEF